MELGRESPPDPEGSSAVIVLLRGPGGPFRRLAADFVPFLVAAHAFVLLWPFWGAVPAAFVALLAFAGLSAGLRVVRRRPAPRFLWRLALLGWALYACGLGLADSRREPPRPSEPAGVRAWAAAGPFRAGVASAAFDLPGGTPLGGWGQAPRRVRVPPWFGVGPVGRLGMALCRGGDTGPRAPLFRAGEPAAEPLGARALVLVPDGGDGPPFAIVRLDAVAVDADLCARLLGRVADLGLLPETLLVAATHTHSGPGGHLSAPLAEMAGTGWRRDAVADALLEAAERALRDAFAGAVPARLAWVRAAIPGPGGESLLGRNRRGGAVDGWVDGWRLDRADGAPLAALLCAAAHPVIHRASHPRFERDLAGALEDDLGRRLGAPVLFVNGAVADVTPRRGGGDPGARCRELAAEVGAAVEGAFRAAPAVRDLRALASRRAVPLGTAHAVVSLGDRAAAADLLGAAPWERRPVWNALALPLNALVWSAGFPEVRVGFTDTTLAASLRLDRLVGGADPEVGVWVLGAARRPRGPSAGWSRGCRPSLRRDWAEPGERPWRRGPKEAPSPSDSQTARSRTCSRARSGRTADTSRRRPSTGPARGKRSARRSSARGRTCERWKRDRRQFNAGSCPGAVGGASSAARCSSISTRRWKRLSTSGSARIS
jgi:hypothetical protein